MSSAKERWLLSLVSEFGADLQRFLASRLADRSNVEDLAQEVYLRLLRVDNFSLIRDPRAFALRIASNLAHEWRLKASNRMSHSPEPLEVLEADSGTPFDTISHTEDMKRLSDALTSLPPVCRSVVLLHRRDGLTYEEIAANVHLSVGMVKKHLAKGLAVCQRRLIDKEVR